MSVIYPKLDVVTVAPDPSEVIGKCERNVIFEGMNWDRFCHLQSKGLLWNVVDHPRKLKSLSHRREYYAMTVKDEDRYYAITIRDPFNQQQCEIKPKRVN